MFLLFILYVSFFDSLILNLIKDYGPVAGPCIGAFVGAFSAFIFYNISAKWAEGRGKDRSQKKVASGLKTELTHINETIEEILNDIEEYDSDKLNHLANLENPNYSENKQIYNHINNLNFELPISLDDLIYFKNFSIDLMVFKFDECKRISDFFYYLHDNSLKSKEIMRNFQTDSFFNPQKHQILLQINSDLSATQTNIHIIWTKFHNETGLPGYSNLKLINNDFDLCFSHIKYIISGSYPDVSKKSTLDTFLQNLKNFSYQIQPIIYGMEQKGNNYDDIITLKSIDQDFNNSISKIEEILFNISFSENQWTCIKELFKQYLHTITYIQKEIESINKFLDGYINKKI